MTGINMARDIVADETVLSSATDSLAETKLFDKSLQHSTGEADSLLPTTVDTSPAVADDDEDVWAADTLSRSNKDSILERAKCPVHRRVCNPNLCDEIKQHVKSLGLDIRDLRAGGPSNIRTVERGTSLSCIFLVFRIAHVGDTNAERRLQSERGEFDPGRGFRGNGRGFRGGFDRGRGRGHPPTRW